jgi:hypothetical protein
VDPSRLDSEVAVRLRLTGHHRDAIVRVVREGAAAARPGERRDWDAYARRAVSFAFGVPGDRLVHLMASSASPSCVPRGDIRAMRFGGGAILSGVVDRRRTLGRCTSTHYGRAGGRAAGGTCRATRMRSSECLPALRDRRGPRGSAAKVRLGRSSRLSHLAGASTWILNVSRNRLWERLIVSRRVSNHRVQ